MCANPAGRVDSADRNANGNNAFDSCEGKNERFLVDLVENLSPLGKHDAEES